MFIQLQLVMRLIMMLFVNSIITRSFAQDTSYIKVHFLYGSKPQKQYRDSESKWFGGKLGGHAGIEVDSNRILNFLPEGKFHWFGSKTNKHSKYALHSEDEFYAILGGTGAEVKKAVVTIPVTVQQKQLLDSLSTAYLHQTPYDYALVGMRCGAATYEIIARLQLLKSHSLTTTTLKIPYPKKLRKRLFKQADKQGWKVERQEGSVKRIWEKD